MADLPNRDQHEATFAARLSRLSAKHRNQLIRLMGHPPDPRRVPESFWAQVEEENTEALAAMLLLIAMLSAARHGADDRVSQDIARSYASQKSKQVASQYTQHSREMLGTAATDWGVTTTTHPDDVPTGKVTKAEVADRVTKIFGPTRSEMIAVNETTDANTTVSEKVIKDQGLADHRDIWWTEADARVCPICRPLHRTRRGVWGRVFPSGPPAHLRCRCWISYWQMK